MQAKNNGFARGEMFICSKLGHNRSEMKVRTFVRMVETRMDTLKSGWTHYVYYYIFSFCNSPRPFCRPIQLKVRKRCSNSRLSSQAIIRVVNAKVLYLFRNQGFEEFCFRKREFGKSFGWKSPFDSFWSESSSSNQGVYCNEHTDKRNLIARTFPEVNLYTY